MGDKLYKTYELEIWQGDYSIDFIQSLGIGPLFSGFTITVEDDDVGTLVGSNWYQDAYFNVAPPSRFYNASSGNFRENLIKENYDFPCLGFTNKFQNGNFIDTGSILDLRKFYYPDSEINYYPRVDLQQANNQKQLSYEYINNQPDGSYLISSEPKFTTLDTGVQVPESFAYLQLQGLVNINKVNQIGQSLTTVWSFTNSGWTGAALKTTVILKEVGANTQQIRNQQIRNRQILERSHPSLLNSSRFTNYLIPTVTAIGAGLLIYYLIDKNNRYDNKKKVKQIKY